jgi:hypothetical protein
MALIAQTFTLCSARPGQRERNKEGPAHIDEQKL